MASAIPISLATINGSGLNKIKKISPAKKYAAAANINGPARAGIPIDSATFPITLTKLGPATAPNVLDTIAVLTAFAR